jgi:hypothetical protein
MDAKPNTHRQTHLQINLTIHLHHTANHAGVKLHWLPSQETVEFLRGYILLRAVQNDWDSPGDGW